MIINSPPFSVSQRRKLLSYGNCCQKFQVVNNGTRCGFTFLKLYDTENLLSSLAGCEEKFQKLAWIFVRQLAQSRFVSYSLVVIKVVRKKGRKVNDNTDFNSSKRLDLIAPINRLVQQVFVHQVSGQGCRYLDS